MLKFLNFQKGAKNLEERLFFDAQTLNNVTLEDCVQMYHFKNYSAICNDGRLLGFVKEPSGAEGEHMKLIWLNAAI